MMHVDPARFRDAMSLTASGVTVVTTDGVAGRAGLTVSTLCSLSLEPPSVLLSVHHESRTLPVILENGTFVANVLGVHQARFAEIFAGRVPELQNDRFAEGRWLALDTGSPALEGAHCAFDCKVAEVFHFGSHRIVAGIVIAIETAPSQPLIHSDRRFHRLQAA